MTERKYVFTFTHFACGCAYRTTGDTAVFCPQHREIITGTERIETQEPEIPEVPGMVMNKYVNGMPQILSNSRNNTLHTMTSVLDGRSNEWAEPTEDIVGICPACFIDQETCLETGVAMCECGNEDCSYRWCGSTEGLHAFWRLHALSKSEEETGIPERDIFSHGPYSDLNSKAAAALDREREDLRGRAEELMKEIENAREQAEAQAQAPGETPDPETAGQQANNHQSVYLTPWLDQDYQSMTSDDTRERDWARRTLTGKVTRLHIIMALSPDQPQEG